MGCGLQLNGKFTTLPFWSERSPRNTEAAGPAFIYCATAAMGFWDRLPKEQRTQNHPLGDVFLSHTSKSCTVVFFFSTLLEGLLVKRFAQKFV